MREHRRLHDKRRLGGPTKPYMPPEIPAGEVNVTDPDSRRMKGNRRYIQGYNAQAVVTEQQIVIAAEIRTNAPDFSHLRPMIETALGELEQAGVTDKPRSCSPTRVLERAAHGPLTAEHGIQVLIPPDSGKRDGERPGWTGGRYSFMRRVLASELGKQLYRKRQQSIEPIYGHTKHNRKIYRFNYRGRQAVRTEWRLVTMTHNLTKLHRHHIAHRERPEQRPHRDHSNHSRRHRPTWPRRPIPATNAISFARQPPRNAGTAPTEPRSSFCIGKRAQACPQHALLLSRVNPLAAHPRRAYAR